MTFLSGCESQPIKVKTVTVRLLPDENLLIDTETPVFNGSTPRDLSAHVKVLEASIWQCNVDKGSLREWREGNK